MPTTPSSLLRQAVPEIAREFPPQVLAAKGGDKLEDDFGDFNEEDFDDDFDDDFEEELEDEYDLAEIEGEVEVEEIDDEDLEGLPLDERIVGDDDEEGVPVVPDEEEVEDAE